MYGPIYLDFGEFSTAALDFCQIFAFDISPFYFPICYSPLLFCIFPRPVVQIQKSVSRTKTEQTE
jgi:hypothetical protein